MESQRNFTAADVRRIVDMLSRDESIPQEKVAAMYELVDVLDKFSNMSETGLQEYVASAWRVLSKDEALAKLEAKYGRARSEEERGGKDAL